jgi:phage antirepressor YoqD-like protein
MDKKSQLQQHLTTTLTQVIADYLCAEIELKRDSLRPDAQQISFEEEAQRISQLMTTNITITIDVHLRQLLYPEQKERTDEWLRSQDYMHRREDQNNRPTA